MQFLLLMFYTSFKKRFDDKDEIPYWNKSVSIKRFLERKEQERVNSGKLFVNVLGHWVMFKTMTIKLTDLAVKQ